MLNVDADVIKLLEEAIVKLGDIQRRIEILKTATNKLNEALSVLRDTDINVSNAEGGLIKFFLKIVEDTDYYKINFEIFDIQSTINEITGKFQKTITEQTTKTEELILKTLNETDDHEKIKQLISKVEVKPKTDLPEKQTTNNKTDSPEKQINDTNKNKLDKGNPLNEYAGIVVWSKILEEVKEQLKANKSILPVLRKYYPSVKNKTLKKYRWAYLKQINKGNSNLERLERGKIIKTYGTNNLYENIYKEFKEALTNKKSTYAVLRRYYPNVKKATIFCYNRLYLRYMREETQEPVPPTKRKKMKKIPPINAYKYDDVYETYIKKIEIEKVISAIRQTRYGYQPTSKAIQKETGLSLFRVRAVLHLLLKEGYIAYRIYKGTPIYVAKDNVNSLLFEIRK